MAIMKRHPTDYPGVFYLIGTKQDKKSVGLGLSVAHGIVKSHHGKIDVQSEPGNTTFTITLPEHTEVREELLAAAAGAEMERN